MKSDSATIDTNFAPSSKSNFPGDGGGGGAGLIFINDFPIIVKPIARALMTAL